MASKFKLEIGKHVNSRFGKVTVVKLDGGKQPTVTVRRNYGRFFACYKLLQSDVVRDNKVQA